MSEQPETYIVVNDRSQCSVATWFRCGRKFDN